MTANSPQRSSMQELLQPLKDIMELVGAETAVEAVETVRRMNADLLNLDFLLSNLAVASVVLVADRPVAGRYTVALPRLLDYLEGNGYQFVTVFEIISISRSADR